MIMLENLVQYSGIAILVQLCYTSPRNKREGTTTMTNTIDRNAYEVMLAAALEPYDESDAEQAAFFGVEINLETGEFLAA